MKQLEREVDRHKHGANRLMQRNEQLVKEVEGHRQNLHHTGIQMENMKRELGDALVSVTAVHSITNLISLLLCILFVYRYLNMCIS